jgi:hypothetical protein
MNLICQAFSKHALARQTARSLSTETIMFVEGLADQVDKISTEKGWGA